MPRPALTPTQTAVLHHLLAGHPVTRAAELAGVHRSTVHLWLKQPLFRHTLENTQREHALAIQFSLHAAAEEAVQALRDILADPKASPATKLKAAQYILARLERAQPPIPTTHQETAEVTQALYHRRTPHVQVRPQPHSTHFDTRHAFAAAVENQQLDLVIAHPQAQKKNRPEGVTPGAACDYRQ